MKNLMTVVVLGLAIAAEASSPTLSSVNVRQDSSRLVTISYSVDQDCIVTVDVLTNGVSIGEQNFTNMTGDVNKKVLAGSRAICWKPTKSWPNQRIAAGDMSVQVKAWPLCAPPPYMVVDLYQDGDGYLGDGEFIHYFASTNAFPGGFGNRVYKTTTIVMRHIPAAGIRWRMGMSAADAVAVGAHTNDTLGTSDPYNTITYAESETAHYVTLTNDFWIGVYQVTQAQAKRFSSDGNTYLESKLSDDVWSGLDRDVHPMDGAKYNDLRGSKTVDGIDWPTTGDSVVGYLANFRARVGGLKFDFPTDAQWEFACRAGESGQLYDGSSLYGGGNLIRGYSRTVDALGWLYYTYNDGSSDAVRLTRTYPVGLKKPNNWGLYDMIGNVREYCLDWYAGVTSDEAIDPRGPSSAQGGFGRIVRGGSWSSTNYLQARSAFRTFISPSFADANYGCRLVITIP